MNQKRIVLSSLVFVFSLLAWPKPVHNPGWASGSHIGQGIIVLVLCLAALVLILASLFDLFDRRTRSSGLICIALCLPLPAFVIYGEIQREKRQAVIRKWDAWHGLARKVSQLLIEYHQLHPERFSYVSDQSEEVNVSGFSEFALSRNNSLPSRLTNGLIEILDPWKEPICFVMSRGDDEEISCRGFRQRIIFGGGRDPSFDNPIGLGAARSKPTLVIRNGRHVETIFVYMDVKFSQQNIGDRKKQIERQQEREAKSKLN